MPRQPAAHPARNERFTVSKSGRKNLQVQDNVERAERSFLKWAIHYTFKGGAAGSLRN